MVVASHARRPGLGGMGGGVSIMTTSRIERFPLERSGSPGNGDRHLADSEPVPISSALDTQAGTALERVMARIGPWLAAMATLMVLGGGSASLADEGSPDSPTQYIDRIIRENWEAAGLSPSPRASDGEFLRRVYLDLVGRIPSLRETTGFLESSDRNKRAKLISYLLDHPDYARHFGNLWSVALIGRGDQ